jgi:hypothetical protein
MNEWSIFLVIVEIVVFFITVGGIVVRLNTTIVRLNDSVESLNKSLEDLTVNNAKVHRILWERIDEHEETLNKHETEIQIIKNGRS